MEKICQELAAEHKVLDEIVSALDDKEWETITPFDGWTVKDEISHLGCFDYTATLSAKDPKDFHSHLETLLGKLKTADDFFDESLKPGQEKTPEALLSWWRQQRENLLNTLVKLDPKQRLPWYGPDMSAKSFATARLMETWAHGQDIVDTFKLNRKPTNRLRHIAHIGVTTFKWSYLNRGIDVPVASVYVELKTDADDTWTWGDESSENSVSGPAEDFCLVVIRRRRINDTNLVVKGKVGQEWMKIAQAFAGPAAD